MMATRCGSPIDPAMLADYWAALLSPEEELGVEEHLLCCDSCCASLHEISGLVDAISEMGRSGNLNVIVSQEFLDRAAGEGLRIRQYAPEPGGSVHCTVNADDDLLIARLAADLSSARQVDLCFLGEHGTERLRDIPIRAQSGEVIFHVAIDNIRAAGPHVARVRMVSVEPTGDRVLGEYTFRHTPTPSHR
jgi:hypothetical protein